MSAPKKTPGEINPPYQNPEIEPGKIPDEPYLPEEKPEIVPEEEPDLVPDETPELPSEKPQEIPPEKSEATLFIYH